MANQDVNASDQIGVGDGDVTVDTPRAAPEGTLTESAQVSPQSAKAAADTATATETAGQAAGPNQVNVAETVAVGDGDVTVDTPRAAPEGTLTEQAAVTSDQTLAAADGTGLTETSGQIDTDDNATDVKLSDAAAVSTQAGRSDTVASVDQAAIASPVAAGDTGAAVEAAGPAATATAGDTVAGADGSSVIATGADQSVGVSDAAVTAEQAQIAATQPIIGTDPGVLSDSGAVESQSATAGADLSQVVEAAGVTPKDASADETFLRQVGTIIPHRTIAKGSAGRQLGTFTDATLPSAEQVLQLRDTQAREDVAAALGDPDEVVAKYPELADDVQSLLARATAMWIEVDHEKVYDRLEKRFDGLVKLVRGKVDRLAAGAAEELTPALGPVFSFPAAPRDDWGW